MTTVDPAAEPATAHDRAVPGRARGATRTLLRTEARLLARSPGILVWMVAVPLTALVVLAAVPAARRPVDAFGGLSVLESYQPTLIVFVSTMLAFQVLPMLLGQYRELGFLRRLRATPAHPRQLLTAVLALVLGCTLAVGLVMTFLPLVVGVGDAGRLALTAAALLPVALCFLAVGALLAAVIPDPRVASGVGAALAAAMWFFAGMWYPRAQFPDWLARLADWTPGGAAATVLTGTAHGAPIGWQPAACLTVWALTAAALAVRTFRWE